MAERLGSLGYMGLKKETTKGTAVTPNDYVPLYNSTLMTEINLNGLTPAVANKALRYQAVQGLRAHKGDLTVMAEPNTAAKIVDMILTKTGTTGSGPYTHAFGLSSTTDPNSYTIDISTGNIVQRFFGVQVSELSPVFQENEMRFNVKVSALGSFVVREIASITGTGPCTVTLKTDYDPAPTTGLVGSDLIRFYKVSDGSTIDAAVTAVSNGTAFTTSTDVSSLSAGDMVYLRPASVSLTLQPAFLWSNTQFCFGSTASAALSAAQTRLEKGSAWKLLHPFENENGADRSGAFDPASLIRLTGDANFNIKKFFDTPTQVNDFNALTKRAVVIRHFSSGSTYELRITLNNIKPAHGGQAKVDFNAISYHEMDFMPAYDSSDGQLLDVKVINNLSTI